MGEREPTPDCQVAAGVAAQPRGGAQPAETGGLPCASSMTMILES